jgi:hypothetical protein
MISLPEDRTHAQELIAALAELGVQRVVEVSASEPLFAGDYRAKVERLVRVAL